MTLPAWSEQFDEQRHCFTSAFPDALERTSDTQAGFIPFQHLNQLFDGCGVIARDFADRVHTPVGQ